MTLNPDTEQQIFKDIVRTFPNNPYFQKDNSGYHAMFKVLSAYSNLDGLMSSRKSMKNTKAAEEKANNTAYITIADSPRLLQRSAYRKNRNKILRNELIDSF